MNAYLDKDLDGAFWACGICGEGCINREIAEAHCRHLIEKDGDPMEGRVPPKKLTVKQERSQYFSVTQLWRI